MYFGHEEKKRAIIVIFSFVISLLLIAGGLILDAYGPISEFNYRTLTIYSRATALDGSIQPRNDSDYLDGTNRMPSITLTVE